MAEAEYGDIDDVQRASDEQRCTKGTDVSAQPIVTDRIVAACNRCSPSRCHLFHEEALGTQRHLAVTRFLSAALRHLRLLVRGDVHGLDRLQRRRRGVGNFDGRCRHGARTLNRSRARRERDLRQRRKGELGRDHSTCDRGSARATCHLRVRTASSQTEESIVYI